MGEVHPCVVKRGSLPTPPAGAVVTVTARRQLITWFSFAEDSMNAAFHDSARALPSSQLITLRETERERKKGGHRGQVQAERAG